MKRSTKIIPIIFLLISLVILSCGNRQQGNSIEIPGAIRPASVIAQSNSQKNKHQPTKEKTSEESCKIRLEPIAPIIIAAGDTNGVELDAVAYDGRGLRIKKVYFGVEHGVLKLIGSSKIRYYPPADRSNKQDKITVSVWDDAGHHLEEDVPVTIKAQDVKVASPKPKPVQRTDVKKQPTPPSTVVKKNTSQAPAKIAPQKAEPAQHTDVKKQPIYSPTVEPQKSSETQAPKENTELKITSHSDGSWSNRECLISGVAPAELNGTKISFSVLSDAVYPQGTTTIKNGCFEMLIFLGRYGQDVGKRFLVWGVTQDGRKTNRITLIRQ